MIYLSLTEMKLGYLYTNMKKKLGWAKHMWRSYGGSKMPIFDVNSYFQQK